MTLQQKTIASLVVDYSDGTREVIDFIEKPARYRVRPNYLLGEGGTIKALFTEHEIIWTEPQKTPEKKVSKKAPKKVSNDTPVSK